MSECPISWLRLERYHLGELSEPEREAISAHLAQCEPCRASLASIVKDDAERALPPLPSRSRSPRRSRARVVALVSGGVALAAALLLTVGRRPRSPDETVRAKGSDVSFVLVRDDETVVAEAGGVYHDGDRWKAVVSCPPDMSAEWDLVVYERGEAAFPLATIGPLSCGNSVPLPGAFRVTGHEPLTVCVVWSVGRPLDRKEIARTPPGLLDQASCRNLVAAP